VTPGHYYTFRALVPRLLRPASLRVEIWTYPQLFAAQKLSAGTWVMCDLERLAIWELRLAGDIARQIREAGPNFRLLNDPARAACRYELLLRLHKAAINRFRAWRAEDGNPNARFPVFLRLESNHEVPLSGLLDSADALESAIESQRAKGVSLRGLMIIEYEAKPLAPGVFRKYAAYRIGARIIADHTVHDVTWLAKYGDNAAWSPERYAEEAIYVRDNPHADALCRAFDIACIDYGRADYGMVDGAPQIWEINTNPTIPGGNLRKAPPLRVEATRLSKENRLAAFQAIDISARGPALRLSSDVLDIHRGWQRRFQRHLVRN
jgi:hypothetical protein